MVIKKIFSLLSALTISVMSLSTLAITANAENTANIVVECEPLTITDGSAYAGTGIDWRDYSIGGSESDGSTEYVNYLLKFKLTGIELTTTLSGKSKIFTGTSVTGITLDLNVVSDGTLDNDYNMIKTKSFADSDPASWNGTKFGVRAMNANGAYPANGTAATITASTVSDSLIEVAVVVDKSKPLTITYSGFASTDEFSGSPLPNTNKSHTFTFSPTTTTLPVASDIAVTSVTLDKTTLALTEGDEATLVATVKPDDATDKTVTWSSNAEDVAKVVGGVVTALKAGEATITAKAGDKTATCVVTVSASSPIIEKNETVGQFNGKYLKYIAQVLETVNAQQKVRIKKMNGNEVVETRDSGRTLAQIVNGVASGNNTITGTIAIGVLTSNENDVFTFELYN